MLGIPLNRQVFCQALPCMIPMVDWTQRVWWQEPQQPRSRCQSVALFLYKFFGFTVIIPHNSIWLPPTWTSPPPPSPVQISPPPRLSSRPPTRTRCPGGRLPRPQHNMRSGLKMGGTFTCFQSHRTSKADSRVQQNVALLHPKSCCYAQHLCNMVNPNWSLKMGDFHVFFKVTNFERERPHSVLLCSGNRYNCRIHMNYMRDIRSQVSFGDHWPWHIFKVNKRKERPHVKVDRLALFFVFLFKKVRRQKLFCAKCLWNASSYGCYI